MQVTETLNQGLKREFKVVLPAADLAQRLDGELATMRDKVRINGFRPGKAPLSHLKKIYGRSVMAEVVQNAVNDANRKIVEDNKLRLAMEPKVNFPADQAEVEAALAARGDLAFSIAIETLPDFEVGAFEDVAIEKPVFNAGDDEVDATLKRMSDQNRPFAAKEGAAEKGDKVTIDFVGKIEGEAFEGGTGAGIDVVLGSESFIPGFEDQLVGVKAGDEKLVTVSFPENYSALHLAGKPAEFDVTVKAIAAPGELVLDDEFAKGYGFEALDQLKDAIRGNLQQGYDRASRDKMKRALLDVLDSRYSFELPEGLVEQEFEGIWRQVQQEQQQSGKTFADEGTTEDAAKADYRKIAERRVRLGLVLAAVGEKANVQITDDEVTAALVERARGFPGQEKMIWDFYRKNPQALAEIRAPIFEDKVVDHIVSQAKVTEKPVTREDLFKVEDEGSKA